MTYRSGYLTWSGGGGGSSAWAGITGKPATFPPETHSHTIANVTGLQTALDGKQASGSYANATHGHIIGDVTGLQAALDGKQAAGSYAAATHSHVIADVTGLQAALDGKQAAGSYQPLATVLTNTTAAFTTAQETKLAGIAAGATANSADATLLARANHTGTQTAATISDFTEAAQDVVGAMVAAAGGSYNDGAGSITLPAGGSDPWTYAKLASDFTTTSATAVAVTGLAFTPAANTQYEFECLLLLRTATATVGPRPGLAWPTGGTDGVADIYTPSSATAQTMVFGNNNASLLAAVGGLPNTTQSYPARVCGTFMAGASPSGTVGVQMASETAGTTVTVKAGSFIRWRTI